MKRTFGGFATEGDAAPAGTGANVPVSAQANSAVISRTGGQRKGGGVAARTTETKRTSESRVTYQRALRLTQSSRGGASRLLPGAMALMTWSSSKTFFTSTSIV